MQSSQFRRSYDLLLDSDFAKAYPRSALSKRDDYTFVTDAVRLHDALGEFTPALTGIPASSSRAKTAYHLALSLLVARQYTHWKDLSQWTVDIRRCLYEAGSEVCVHAAEHAFIRMRAPAYESQLALDKKLLQAHNLMVYDVGMNNRGRTSVNDGYRRIKADALKLSRARCTLDRIAPMIGDDASEQLMDDYSALRAMLRASEDFNAAEEAFFIASRCKETRAQRLLTLLDGLNEIPPEKLPPRLRMYHEFLVRMK